MMFLTVLFSAISLLTLPILANPSLEIIHQNHLETASGRTSFLIDKLTPYTETAERMNQEIQALAEQINTLSPQEDQPQILAITQELTQKMETLLKMMPALTVALSINEDLEQIDPILHQTDPLTPEQQQTIDRIALICSAIEES